MIFRNSCQKQLSETVVRISRRKWSSKMVVKNVRWIISSDTFIRKVFKISRRKWLPKTSQAGSLSSPYQPGQPLHSTKLENMKMSSNLVVKMSKKGLNVFFNCESCISNKKCLMSFLITLFACFLVFLVHNIF